MDYRRPQRASLGHAGDDHALRALYRRVDFSNFPPDSGSRRSMFLITAALFIVAETIVGQAIEPLVYGQSTGLSPVAIIVSATFWTWLWGPVGLILATPLSMCLVVVGRHVDRLEFLEVMFGDRPPLTPAELIYQRMLANDPIEAAEQADVPKGKAISRIL